MLLLALDFLLLTIYGQVVEKSTATIFMMSAISSALLGTWLHEGYQEIGLAAGVVTSCILSLAVALLDRR